MKYLATVNIPGYLPQDDEPPTFDTAREAWEYLADERERDELPDDLNHLSRTWRELYALGMLDDPEHTQRWIAVLGLDPDGTGTIYGPTPGYDGQHDLGLAYSVTRIDE